MQFEKSTGDNYPEVLKIISDLQEKDQNLYATGCLIENAYKYAQLMYSGEDTYYICEYFIDWVNQKKNSYISSGDKCRNIELWDEYIEKIWTQLEKTVEDGNYCSIKTVTHECSKISAHVTGIVVSFFLLATFATVFFLKKNFTAVRQRLHNFLSKNERIRNHIYKYAPKGLLEYSENMDTHLLDERINLSYYSSHNS
ncbi:PIR Superfamily Protein [Plasmodium ovale wallikeri]|uniref:PIR Superfamily Protein n=1 Tax=Plasmodium ovale wallikeri TaxID=864142 RepID=A0A1A9A8C1_PLAOA|nr:PIR Superfamily Protein [Plasmodium ovale wallikeri]